MANELIGRAPTEAEIEAFDEVFFARHGVGDVPLDPNFVAIAHSLDPREPTLPEAMYCRNLIKGMSSIEAYIKAFSVPDDTSQSRAAISMMATRLSKRPRVARALYKMQEKVNALVSEDMATLIDELNQDRKLARDLGQPSAAISAVKVKASLLGLDQSNVQANITINLSDDQKSNLLDRIGKRIGHTPNAISQIEEVDYRDVTDD